jgi:hypothetical protein
VEKQKSNGLGEGVNDIIRKLQESREDFSDWLALHNPLIEYDHATCSFTHHIHVRATSAFSEEFCAVFDIGRNVDEFTGIDAPVREGVDEGHSLGIGDAGIEQSVLIRIPEFLQYIQRVGRIVWPKRLQALNDCLRSRVNAINHGKALAVVIPILDTGLDSEDREAGYTLLGNRNHFPNGVFQRGARLVNDFTCDNGILDEEIARDEGVDNQVHLPAIWLVQEAKSIRAFVSPEFTIELVEVIISPVEFSSGTLQRITWHDVRPDLSSKNHGGLSVENQADVIRQLSKKWLETGDDAFLDELNHATHDGVHFHVRDRRIIERYREFSLELHAHFFNVSNAASVNDDLCAVAQYFRRDCGADNAPLAVDHDNVLIVPSDGRQGECSVLINIHELIQDPEGMKIGALQPGVVRLQTLDECFRANGYATESIARDLTLETERGFAEGELISLGRRLPVYENQLPDYMVQRGAEVVQALPNDDTQSKIGFGETYDEPEFMVAIINVALGDHAAFFQARLKSGLYRCKMFLCPDEFLPNAVEGMVHSTKSESNEFGLEVDNQVVNHVNSESHSPEDWLRFDHVRLCDGYIKGDLHIFVVFKCTNYEGLADFQCIPEVRGGKPRENKVETSFSGGNYNSADLVRNGEQSMVLVGNVQSMECPEITSLPFFVRFGSSDLVLRAVPHSLYFSSKSGFVDFVAAKDRERCFVEDWISSNRNKVTSQMVESTSEVVDNVASNQGDVRVNFLKTGREESVKAFVSGLRIRLGADSIRCTFDESIFDDFEILEVCIGPFDFSSDERKSFIGSH